MTNEGTDESETVNSLFLKGLELHDKIVDGAGEISDEVTEVRKVRTQSQSSTYQLEFYCNHLTNYIIRVTPSSTPLFDAGPTKWLRYTCHIIFVPLLRSTCKEKGSYVELFLNDAFPLNSKGFLMFSIKIPYSLLHF